MTILETKDLKKYYGSGDTAVKALDGVNLAVEQGEFVAVHWKLNPTLTYRLFPGGTFLSEGT